MVEVIAGYFESTFNPAEVREVGLNEKVESTTRRMLVHLEDTAWNFNPVSILEVKKYARLANPREAPEYDLVSYRIAREFPIVAYHRLSNLLTHILLQHHSPSLWKHSVTTPVPKPGKPPNKASSYRPIQLYPTFSKMAERAILSRLRPFVDKYIPDEQFGFRAEHSTTQQIMRVVGQAASRMNQTRKGLQTGVVLLDKAFDSVWHPGLLLKLLWAKVPIKITRLLARYLTNRTFEVKVRNTQSTRRTVRAGVPQGSVLGPTLYSIFLTDFSRPRKDQLAIYADDTAVYKTHCRMGTIVKTLNKPLERIAKWMDLWRIKVNADKCEYIVLSRRLKRTLDIGPMPKLRGVILQRKETARYLGVTLDRKLTFTRHLKERRALAYGRLTGIRAILNRKSALTTTTGLTIYKTVIRPVLTYASPLWCQVGQAKTDSYLRPVKRTALRRAQKLHPWHRNSEVYDASEVKLITEQLTTSAVKFWEVAKRSKYRLIRELAARLARRGKIPHPRDVLLD